MLYIVRVFDDYGKNYEYEYGCIEHVKEHMKYETGNAKVYKYEHGMETEVEL